MLMWCVDITKHEKEFVNTGVAHKQTDDGDIYMDQDNYIDDLYFHVIE